MELKQTKLQNVIDRVYNTALSFLLPQLVVLLFISFQGNQYSLWPVIILFIGFNICVPVWLLFFNIGQSKLDSFSIKIDDQEIAVSRYGNIRKINVDAYLGYKITWLIPKEIKLFEASGKNIIFSYYALNRQQRSVLFDVLGPANS